MARISIVVPIYNVEKYLSFCLDSLRRQTEEDIEILCIDDGSKDRSSCIARMHASCDSRIRVISKQNGGLSSARNAGIKASTGQYVMFVDSDDYLDKKACETLLKVFDSSNADLVTFGASCVPSCDGNPWLERCLSPEAGEYQGFDEELLYCESARPYAWRTAANRAFLINNELMFNEDVLFGEDQVFHFEAYALSRKTILIPNKLYNYRVSRSGSLMSENTADLRIKIARHLDIVEAIVSAWQKRGLDHLCSSRFVDWVEDFLLPDMFRLGANCDVFLYKRFCGLLEPFDLSASWSEGALSPKLKKMLNCMDADYIEEKSVRKLKRSYEITRFGLLSYCFNMVKRPFSRVKRGLKRVLPLPASSTLLYLAEVEERMRAEEGMEASLVLLDMECSWSVS